MLDTLFSHPEIMVALSALVGVQLAKRDHPVQPDRVVSVEDARLEKIATAYVNNGLSHLELEQSIWHVLKGGALDGNAKPARTKLATQLGEQNTSNATDDLFPEAQDMLDAHWRRSPFPEPQMETTLKMMHGGFGADGPVARVTRTPF